MQVITLVLKGRISHFVKCNRRPFNLWVTLSHQVLLLSFHRDPQRQVGENYLLNMRPTMSESWCLNIHYIADNCDN